MKPVQHACAAAVALPLLCAPVPAAVDSAAPATEAESSVEVPPEYAALREQAIALHDRAVEGDEDSAEQAVARLERYLKRFADDAEARAYLGSAYTMMARDASSVVNKTRYANRGVRHLDRALDAGAPLVHRAPGPREREFEPAEDVRPWRRGARGHAGARRESTSESRRPRRMARAHGPESTRSCGAGLPDAGPVGGARLGSTPVTSPGSR